MSSTERPNRPALVAPVAPMLHAEGVELRYLWRYGAVAALMVACALLSTWSRVDLVETSVALHKSRSAHRSALAERQRLTLELASLRDPQTLEGAAAAMSLDNTVPVVELGQSGTN